MSGDLKNVPAGPCQEILVVVVKDSVAPASEVNAAALPANLWSVQLTGYVWSQLSTGGGGVRQQEEVENVEDGPILSSLHHATVADVKCVAALDQVGSDEMTNVEVMMEKRETGKLSLHDDLVAEWAARVRALINTNRLQRD